MRKEERIISAIARQYPMKFIGYSVQSAIANLGTKPKSR